MNIATIQVSGVNARAVNSVIVPQGIVGASVTFDFLDPRWKGLSKTAVFQGDVTRDVIVQGNTAIIPAETVVNEGTTLKVGVYGTDDKNNLAIPTLWATIGKVGSAADPSGDTGTEPDLPIWAQLADEVDRLKRTDSGGNVDQTNKWSGKIASFIGDSITAGINTEKTYHAFLREKVGFSTCNNYGIDGSSVSNKNAPMCTRVSNVAENSDIIFVFGGTNDFYLSVPMGEWYTIDGTTRAVNYDTSTFKGALSTLCNALLTRFSDRKIVLMTPLHRHTFGSQYTELQENAQGLHLENYVDAVKEAGKMYGLPVIDLYGESGLFPRNEANAAIYFHTNDKLHPNAKGHEVIANVILGFLEKTYPMVSGQASDEPEIPEIPEVTMTSISATYSGGDVTEGTPVTALTGIVVTAHYSDGTNETVTGYTLFGTITEGNNTITVGYQGKNAVFTVVGVAQYAFLYKLPEAKTFNGTSDYIDTGVNLIEQDIDWTIAFDAVTAKTIGGYSIGIFYCMQTTQPWPGYCFKIQAGMYVFAAGDSYANTNIPDRANMGMKVVITHKAGSNKYSVKYLYDGTISEVSATWAFLSGSTSLYIGAYNQGGITGFWTGTVNDFKVYNGVLSDSAIEAYLT